MMSPMLASNADNEGWTMVYEIGTIDGNGDFGKLFYYLLDCNTTDYFCVSRAMLGRSQRCEGSTIGFPLLRISLSKLFS